MTRRIAVSIANLPELVRKDDPMSQRRFPPPWSVEELDECFVVRDHSGQTLDNGPERTSSYFPRA